MDLKFEGGFWWPNIDLPRGFDRYVRNSVDMMTAIKFCKKKNVVVQAGGHCGVWPIKLAGIFERVYTFEPDLHNFRALMANVREENIFAMRGVLGVQAGFTGMHKNPKNTGGHWVEGDGPTPVFSIDQFDFDALDLMLLDIEGSELFALQGAFHTIKKFSPVIMLEDNGNAELKGGYPSHMVYDFLKDMGYELAATVRDDKIWVKK